MRSKLWYPALVLGIVAASCSSTPDDVSTAAENAVLDEADPSDADSAPSEADAAANPPAVASAAPLDLAPAGPWQLVDATADFGIDTALAGIHGHAVAAADVNGDGWTDLFVGTFADRPIESYQFNGADGPSPDRLLLGGPDGFSVDESFQPEFGRAAGAHFADLDGDGDPDLVVSRNPRDSERGAAPTEVYRNTDGQLVAATVLDDLRGGRDVDTLDLDGDGLLDIILVEDRWSSDSSTAVFHNDGELSFTEVTSEVGLPGGVFGLGLGLGDLNNDGLPDLVVGGTNRIFLGSGDGFTEADASPLPWALPNNEDDPAHVIITDINGDGTADIVMGQHFNSTVDFGLPEPVRVFANRGSSGGQPTFDDVTLEVGSPPLDTKSPQILLVDLDGDGVGEVVTTATYEDNGAKLPLVLSVMGSGDELRLEPSVGAVDAHYWIDAVVLDANRDGRMDLFFVEWEPELGSRLFLNLPAE